MRTKALISLAALLTLLAGSACTRQDPLPTGEVTLTFSVGQPETRANIIPGVTGPGDGGKIYCVGDTPDLYILIANSDGSIVARYPDDDPESGPASSCTVNAARTEADVTFSGVSVGEYTVYAIANTGDGVWGAPDEDDWDAITTATALEALTLNHAVDYDEDGVNDPRPLVTDRMPLSARGPLTVHATGNGEVSLELLRCVVGVRVQFENATSGKLDLTDVSISIGNINPTQGTLIPPASGDDVSGTRETLSMSAASLEIAKGETALLSASTYFVFPSVAPGGTYYCQPVSFSWTQTPPASGSSGTGSYTSEAPGLRIHDKKSEDIPALLRNQLITIQIRIANNSDISFNFIVSDWSEKKERVWFD